MTEDNNQLPEYITKSQLNSSTLNGANQGGGGLMADNQAQSQHRCGHQGKDAKCAENCGQIVIQQVTGGLTIKIDCCTD